MWSADADACLNLGNIECARAILNHAKTVFPNREDSWLEAISLEQKHGTADAVDKLLRQSVINVPSSPLLWLMAAKHKWKVQGDVPGKLNL